MKRKNKKQEKHIDAETEFIRLTMCDKQPVDPWHALVQITGKRNISDVFFELTDQSQIEILDFLKFEAEQPGIDPQIAKTWQAKVKETKVK